MSCIFQNQDSRVLRTSCTLNLFHVLVDNGVTILSQCQVGKWFSFLPLKGETEGIRFSSPHASLLPSSKLMYSKCCVWHL